MIGASEWRLDYVMFLVFVRITSQRSNVFVVLIGKIYMQLKIIHLIYINKFSFSILRRRSIDFTRTKKNNRLKMKYKEKNHTSALVPGKTWPRRSTSTVITWHSSNETKPNWAKKDPELIIDMGQKNKIISDGGITVDFSIIKVHTSNWSSNSWGSLNSWGSSNTWGSSNSSCWDHRIVGDHRIPLDL